MLVLGKVPGSLAMTNIAGNAMFGSISGSGIAAATAIGGVMQPLEDEQGYDRAFSAAANVASAPVGQLIPPKLHSLYFQQQVVEFQLQHYLWLAGFQDYYGHYCVW